MTIRVSLKGLEQAGQSKGKDLMSRVEYLDELVKLKVFRAVSSLDGLWMLPYKSGTQQSVRTNNRLFC